MRFSNVDFTTKEFILDDNIHTYHQCDFTGADLSGRDLKHFTFIGCKLEKTNFESTRLDYAVFDNCTLDGSTLKNVTGARTQFVYCDLLNTNFYAADLIGATFGRCNAAGAIFKHANLCQASLLNTRLTGADLTGVVLSFATGNGAEVKSFVPTDKHCVVYTVDKVWLNSTSHNIDKFLDSTLSSDGIGNFMNAFPATPWLVEKREVKIVPLVLNKDGVYHVQLKICLPTDCDGLLQSSYIKDDVFCAHTLNINWGSLQIVEDNVYRCRDLMFSTTFPDKIEQIKKINVEEIRKRFNALFP